LTQVLIFANGDANDGPMVRRTLAAAPGALVIAADGGARVAQYYGLAVDLIVGDMDSLAPDELTAFRAQGVEVEQHSVHKNETDLELALIKAVERGANWIRILGAVGDRLDQTLSNVYLLALPILNGCDARLVAGKQETRLLTSGEWTIEGEAGDTISLIPLSGVARGIRTDGLYYPLNDEDLLFGPARGVSNVMNSSAVRVCLREGVLLLVHTIGRA
jgi:thiamine pyrophosphokinase